MVSEADAFTTDIAEAPLKARYGPLWRLALTVSGALVALLGVTLAASAWLGGGISMSRPAAAAWPERRIMAMSTS